MDSDDKLWSGLSYLGLLLCAIPTIIILVIKKDDSEVIKFQSLQALGLFVASFVLSIILGVINTLAGAILPPLAILTVIVGGLLNLAVLGYWLFLTVKVFMGDDIEIPAIGPLIKEHLM